MKLKQNSFLQVFGDAIYHADQAIQDDVVASARHVRTSILFCSIALECAANCSLSIVEVSSECRQDLDKLSPINKFETVARLRDCEFNRGENVCQKVVEIAKIRNMYVHPKIANIPVDLDELKDAGDAYAISISMTGKLMEGLKIDQNSMFWSHEASTKVLRASVEFYNYYFTDLLSLNPVEVLGLLCPLLFIKEDAPIIFHQECFADDLKLLESLNIKNRFLNMEALPQLNMTPKDPT